MDLNVNKIEGADHIDEYIKLLTNSDIEMLMLNEKDMNLGTVLFLNIKGSQGHWQIINIFDEGIICSRYEVA